MYYSVVYSLNDLLGDEGILRLPSYLPDVFVMDVARADAIQRSINLIIRGRNVLIEGSPGTGKTALMFMILKEIAKKFKIGFIKEGVASIGNAHLNEGVILFYDDIPRMRSEALKSIAKNNVRGIIATGRSEEIFMVRRLYGINLYDYFESIKVPPLEKSKIREMLLRYLESESITVRDKEAIDVIVKKSQGLPVYIWQVIRELKINKSDLTLDFAKRIPQGMLDYVDDILWRILGGKEERYEVLLTFLIMTDFVKYSVHQDLYTYIYQVAKERRLKRKISREEIMFDQVFDEASRYLAREGSAYSFRLPHDSWADVLRGKSNGPMAPEISKINMLYDRDARREIVINAARRAWHEVIKKVDDPFRISAFERNIELNFGSEVLRDIKESPLMIEVSRIPARLEKAGAKMPSFITMDSLEILRTNLAALKVASIKMLAKKMGISEKETKNLLEISNFHTQSKRKGFIYYKDHYLGALKKAEDILKREGVINIKRLAERIRIFPEDLKEYLARKYIIVDDKAYTLEHIEGMLLRELKEKGKVNLREFEERKRIPMKILEKFRDKLKRNAIQSPYSGTYYAMHVVGKRIMEVLKKLEIKGMINIESEAKELDIPKEIIEREIQKYAEKSPTKLGYYYPKGTIERIKKIITSEIKSEKPKSIKGIAELLKVFEEDIEKIITETIEGKEYIKKRLKYLIKNPKPREMKKLSEIFEKHELNYEEKRLLELTYLILGATIDKSYIEKSEELLKELVRKIDQEGILSLDDVQKWLRLPRNIIMKLFTIMEKEGSIKLDPYIYNLIWHENYVTTMEFLNKHINSVEDIENLAEEFSVRKDVIKEFIIRAGIHTRFIKQSFKKKLREYTKLKLYDKTGEIIALRRDGVDIFVRVGNALEKLRKGILSRILRAPSIKVEPTYKALSFNITDFDFHPQLDHYLVISANILEEYELYEYTEDSWGGPTEEELQEVQRKRENLKKRGWIYIKSFTRSHIVRYEKSIYDEDEEPYEEEEYTDYYSLWRRKLYCLFLLKFDKPKREHLEEGIYQYTSDLSEDLPIISISCSAKGQYIAIGTKRKDIKIIDTKRWREIDKITCDDTPIKVEWDPNGKKLAVAYENGYVDIYSFEVHEKENVRSHNLRLLLRLNAGSAPMFSWSHTGRFLVLANSEGLVQIVDVAKLSKYYSFNYGGHISHISCSPYGYVLAICGGSLQQKSREITFFDIINRRYLATHKISTPVVQMMWCNDGRSLMTYHLKSWELWVWEFKT